MQQKNENCVRKATLGDPSTPCGGQGCNKNEPQLTQKKNLTPNSNTPKPVSPQHGQQKPKIKK